jgi:hypothetical protein
MLGSSSFIRSTMARTLIGLGNRLPGEVLSDLPLVRHKPCLRIAAAARR